MKRDWGRLGRALADARKRTGHTQTGVAEAIGVSRTPIQAIERGTEFDKVTGTIREYARLVGWTAESIEAVLAGGEPRLTAEAAIPATSATASLLDDLPLRIVEEIGEGPLLDTTVLDLGPGGSGARMIVVVRGAPDATPEEIRRDLLAWRKAQRHLADLGDDETEPPAADQA